MGRSVTAREAYEKWPVSPDTVMVMCRSGGRNASAAAMKMVPVSEEEWFCTPASMAEREEMRLENLAAQGHVG